jgi:hypothetical protein
LWTGGFGAKRLKDCQSGFELLIWAETKLLEEPCHVNVRSNTPSSKVEGKKEKKKKGRNNNEGPLRRLRAQQKKQVTQLQRLISLRAPSHPLPLLSFLLSLYTFLFFVLIAEESVCVASGSPTPLYHSWH